MNRAVRDSVFEKDNYTCAICGKKIGMPDPHHIIFRSQAKYLENCDLNIITTDRDCHELVHVDSKLDKRLKREYQAKIAKRLIMEKYYSIDEISQICHLEQKRVEKCITKGFLKFNFIDGQIKSTGEEVLRFMMGGKLI